MEVEFFKKILGLSVLGKILETLSLLNDLCIKYHFIAKLKCYVIELALQVFYLSSNQPKSFRLQGLHSNYRIGSITPRVL